MLVQTIQPAGLSEACEKAAAVVVEVFYLPGYVKGCNTIQQKLVPMKAEKRMQTLSNIQQNQNVWMSEKRYNNV